MTTSAISRPSPGPAPALPAERYLTVKEVAARLGTTDRFPRRLIEERRIEFVRIGRHVRIAESTLAAYVASCVVSPAPSIRRTAS